MSATSGPGSRSDVQQMKAPLASRLLQASRHAIRRPWHALVVLPPTRLLIALTVLLLMSSWGVAAWFAFRSHRSVIGSSEVVVEALGIEASVQAMLARLDRMEGAGRAYLLTRHDEHRIAFQKLAGSMTADLDALARLVAGSESQRAELERIRLLVRERWETLDRPFQAEDTLRGESSAFTVAMNQRGIELMEAIHAGAWRMIATEQNALVRRQQDLAVQARFGSAWLAFFFAVNTVFAGVTLLLAIRMRRLQRFAKVCAWSRTIEYEGEWITFEQYLERRFKIRTSHGISPAEAAKLMSQSPDSFAKPAGDP